jgi:hypothetical protein
MIRTREKSIFFARMDLEAILGANSLLRAASQFELDMTDQALRFFAGITQLQSRFAPRMSPLLSISAYAYLGISRNCCGISISG